MGQAYHLENIVDAVSLRHVMVQDRRRQMGTWRDPLEVFCRSCERADFPYGEDQKAYREKERINVPDWKC